MNILGISAFYHDAAACITINGKIIAAAQEERFTRIKNDASFPKHAIDYCLKEASLTLAQLDAIVFYDKPFLKFERLLDTYYAFAPIGIHSFIKAMPVWIKEKLFLKSLLRKKLKACGQLNKESTKLLFSEHHLSHAASAFYPSPFKEAAILTIDGVGEWATTSISIGKDKHITTLKELHFPHSVGLLYSAFTYFLGFKVNSGEYKLMGLAPYGNKDGEQVKHYMSRIRENLVDLKEDGSIFLNQDFFQYATSLNMIHEKRWTKLFGFVRRLPEAEIEQHHCDLALAIQTITEEIILNLVKETKRLTAASHLCLAGGVALNCVANGKLIKEKIFDKIFVQPAAGDAGGAIGAALAGHHIFFEQERTITLPDAMQGSLLGPVCTDEDMQALAIKHKAVFSRYETMQSLHLFIAECLAEGAIVGHVSGRMEFGPRALGNRSILADARNTVMQHKLNISIKKRESFRPFAPAVLAEDASLYFDLNIASPYMLFVAPVKQERQLKTNQQEYKNIQQKINQIRSDVPAITHVDMSARLQTVHKEIHPDFHSLISTYKQVTGYGILINTSFNVQGEPVVCTAEDAYLCFMKTDIDYLIINNYLFKKQEQPAL